MRKIKVAHVGVGYWGKNILRNLKAMENVEIVSICDADARNLYTASNMCGSGIIYTPNYGVVLNNPNIEAVVFATPPQTHYKLARQALKAGKHAFIEKPMTTNSGDAQDLVDISKENKLVLMTGHTFVYNPVINDLKNMIAMGELGDIYYIDFQMTNLGKYQKDNILFDLAPHGISIILHLLNNPEIKKVSVNGISAIKTGLIDIAYLTLYFEKGFANMHFSWLNPNKTRQLTVVGSKKMAVFDDINPLEKLRVYDKGISEDKSFSSWGDSIVGYRHGGINIPVTSTGEPLRNEMSHFIDCILNNKTPITDGLNGLTIVETIEEANRQLEK